MWSFSGCAHLEKLDRVLVLQVRMHVHCSPHHIHTRVCHTSPQSANTSALPAFYHLRAYTSTPPPSPNRHHTTEPGIIQSHRSLEYDDHPPPSCAHTSVCPAGILPPAAPRLPPHRRLQQGPPRHRLPRVGPAVQVRTHVLSPGGQDGSHPWLLPYCHTRQHHPASDRPCQSTPFPASPVSVLPPPLMNERL